MYRGIYAVGHANPPLEGHFLAAVKTCGPRAVLSQFSAAALWGFWEWDDRYPEVTVPRTSSPKHPGVFIHRSRSLAAVDTTRHRGIPVTSPARTALDLAARLDRRPLRRLVREAQGQRRVSARQLAEVLRRLAPCPGSPLLADVIAPGPAPPRSELEDVVLDLILAGGLEHPGVNVPIVVAGRRVIPDFRWPAQRLVLEADGATWHDSPVGREDDAERQALLEAAGERVLRVTWRQALTKQAETLARLRAAGAPGG